MIFGTLIRQAQHSVDTAVSHIVNRVLVALPFVVAVGFGTAALSIRLNRELGPELGNLALAAIFVGVGLIAAVIFRTGSTPSHASETAVPHLETANAKDETAPNVTPADRELLIAALTSAAPIALPGLIRILLRNLPLLAVVAGMIYVVSQKIASSDDPVSTPDGVASEPDAEPLRAAA